MAHLAQPSIWKFWLPRILAALIVVAILAAGVLASRSPDPAGALPTATAAVVDQRAAAQRAEARADVCALRGGVLADLAERMRRAFEEHAHAHHLFQQKKIPMGPKDQPGTVLYIWRKTLAEREEVDAELRKAGASFRRDCV